MALLFLRSRSHLMASQVLTTEYHLFIRNYIRSFLNNIVRPILMVGRLNPCHTACVSDTLAN